MSLAGASKIKCGSFDLDYSNKTLIMGILNVTPDSFSDGGKYNRIDAALKHAERMVNDGADILDVGGESTRPNYERISEEEEIERVAPIIEAISRNIEVPISVDTYKSRVAEAAVKAGAHILNDIWGGKADSLMSKVAAEYKVPIILMHNRGDMEYGHFVRDVLQDLFESIMLVKDAGVKDENIILDPGIGFAKDLKLNLEMMRNLDKLVSLGYPVLLATSRKSMIGHVLDLPPSERMEGTAATICHGILQGCQMVRVHDVKEMARTAKMMDALLGKGE
ncbi:dihydropteroate synthase [Peribacillus frigoritolerans]|jgi:dihydropteroate synthase|uniref:dihydropteroate synthase n=1 Tax=Peribacillus TaxID=2675229 RepID=UPI0006AC7E7A|nr:dihydropteroate synthase [Peribacillus frigoritolerans]KOR81324.1 dihydropteroate synthase [Bacillus sp. FJAT-21352]AZV61843.1 dihydropteroate synthase [Peribacillus frigoritolerans]MDM5304094.1 dihydropteroate synthase [Peribacillus frigoritolerans]MED4689755.1 dihydropteroate synthase [Peribacillus frigoritolerans]USK80531.1 dihydropteroate synthase [Peribacillus frigoritolerans]